ncbi:MAG TPA: IS66 family insertion sequence element accessory protein TnpB, partial [Tepidisphaeraceae bacterium]|nr:IS66 family insertion sequence element accessory protein TnpB [Tepidisphaeraceae bacterium]
DRAAAVRIWLAVEPADMRCGFDRLAERAAEVTGQDPLSGHLFLFRGRGGDRLKILYWDRETVSGSDSRRERYCTQFCAYLCLIWRVWCATIPG